MILDTNAVTKICDKLRIDVKQFFFLYLIYTKDKISVMRYVNHIEAFPDAFREELEKKGLLLDANTYYKPEDFDSDGNKNVMLSKLHTTPKFDQVIKEFEGNDMSEAYDELLDVYPYEIVGGNGQKYPARTGMYEDNSTAYLKYIRKMGQEEHDEIVKATKYGRDNGLIKWGIQKYIESRYWGLMIEAMRNSENRDSNVPKYGENEF